MVVMDSTTKIKTIISETLASNIDCDVEQREALTTALYDAVKPCIMSLIKSDKKSDKPAKTTKALTVVSGKPKRPLKGIARCMKLMAMSGEHWNTFESVAFPLTVPDVPPEHAGDKIKEHWSDMYMPIAGTYSSLEDYLAFTKSVALTKIRANALLFACCSDEQRTQLENIKIPGVDKDELLEEAVHQPVVVE